MTYDSSYNIQPSWPPITRTRWIHNEYLLKGASIQVVWLAFCCWWQDYDDNDDEGNHTAYACLHKIQSMVGNLMFQNKTNCFAIVKIKVNWGKSNTSCGWFWMWKFLCRNSAFTGSTGTTDSN